MTSGAPVVVSPMLPLLPSHGEDARRLVRHGYADVLAWLGERVGPRPGEATHVIAGSDGSRNSPLTLFVSQEYADRVASGLDVT